MAAAMSLAPVAPVRGPARRPGLPELAFVCTWASAGMVLTCVFIGAAFYVAQVRMKNGHRAEATNKQSSMQMWDLHAVSVRT